MTFGTMLAYDATTSELKPVPHMMRVHQDLFGTEQSRIANLEKKLRKAKRLAKNC